MFSSELSTLSFGQNAVALTAFADLLRNEENLTATIPAIPLPNDEADDTLKTVQDLYRSLEPVSNPIHTEMDEPNISENMGMDIDEPPLHAPNDPPAHNDLSSSSSLIAGTNITHQPQQQSTLQLSGTLAVTRNVTAEASTQRGDRCAANVQIVPVLDILGLDLDKKFGYPRLKS
ncbi:hypothetical protein BT96DRAFT_1006267 [Gymnopus androsaceus JB14]|uniref:Uncharacterized protein n=1 Tax=Gymnopus androsaceus JB14 TaxID=1447944 RepID=A0A6A4GLR8_9AGAR|nr:hypothetical protein BT96DRAFT_1006267 [Gymnopus androsaceus JB14]